MNNKGFTLLEVVIAIVMLAISLTAILKIFSNYAVEYGYFKNEIADIQKVKRYLFNIKEENKDIPKIEIKPEMQKFGLKKEIYLINNKPILFRYER